MRVIDSHTGGEPTRVVIDSADLVEATTALGYRVALERDADWIRTSLTHEPRGAPWMVGALVTPPPTADVECGVVFFNNDGYLGMCGHGLIGVVTTLNHLGRIGPGAIRVDTPVGAVEATLEADGSVSFCNVDSYVSESGVVLTTTSFGDFVGDIAYGGNWFYLTACDNLHELTTAELKDRCLELAEAIDRQGVSGPDDAVIDHVELCGPPSGRVDSDGCNFVLCPGREIDRSPCGTGTSAKVACLADSGLLAPGEIWRQEGVTGSVFSATFQRRGSAISPTIRGRAHVTADSTLVIDPADPLRNGFELGDGSRSGAREGVV